MALEILDYTETPFRERIGTRVDVCPIKALSRDQLKKLACNFALRWPKLIAQELSSMIARQVGNRYGVLHHGGGTASMHVDELLEDILHASDFGTRNGEPHHARQARVSLLLRTWDMGELYAFVSHLAARAADGYQTSDVEDDFLFSLGVLEVHQAESIKSGVMVTDSAHTSELKARARRDDKEAIARAEQQARDHEVEMALRARLEREEAEAEEAALRLLDQPELQDDEIAALAMGSGGW